MSEILKSLSEWRKVGKSLSLIIALMTGMVLFLPDEIVRQTGLGVVKDQVSPYIGLAFFASVAIFFASVVESFVSLLRSGFTTWFNERRWVATLRFLTGEEKEFLKKYIEEDKAAVFADIQSGVASTLACKKILVRTSNVGSPGSMSFPFALQPWARKALSKNRELLG